MKKALLLILLIVLIRINTFSQNYEKEKITILFLSSNPRNSLPLENDREIREITNIIRSSEYRNDFILISRWALQIDDLIDALNECHPTIVHFSCHGNNSGEIILEDANRNSIELDTIVIKRLFSTLNFGIQLVLFNMCYSKDLAIAVVDTVECSIGMDSRISDEAAIIFARSFYRAIGNGNTVQNAFEQGKLNLLIYTPSEEKIPRIYSKKEINLSQKFIAKALPSIKNITNRNDGISSFDVKYKNIYYMPINDSRIVQIFKQKYLGNININSKGILSIGGYPFQSACSATVYWKTPTDTMYKVLKEKIHFSSDQVIREQNFNALKDEIFPDTLVIGTSVIINIDNGEGYFEGEKY
jgi:hypothetical protein